MNIPYDTNKNSIPVINCVIYYNDLVIVYNIIMIKKKKSKIPLKGKG